MICRKCSGLSERSLVAEQILGLLQGIHPARQPRAKEAAEGNARCTVRLLVAADPDRVFHPPWDADGTWPFTVRRCPRRREQQPERHHSQRDSCTLPAIGYGYC